MSLLGPNVRLQSSVTSVGRHLWGTDAIPYQFVSIQCERLSVLDHLQRMSQSGGVQVAQM
jgi:hypothetical protein